MASIEETILNHYGGFPTNSLVDILESDPMEDESGEIQVIRHSAYYTLDKFLQLPKDVTASFIVLSLNIQALLAKIDKLRLFLELLAQNRIALSTVCIQETWIENSRKEMQLKQYLNFSQKG